MARNVTFSPATDPVQSPDRGWWEFAANNFATVREADLRDMRQRGLTVTYALVRLDPFRDRPLTAGFIADLNNSLEKSRKNGIKVILRFAYNYPQSSKEYDQAKDAKLATVLNHIKQLTPLLTANADTITAMQAGFIGAWGEGHTSSNNLDSAENKARIRDALLRAVPKSVPLQWRYPFDLVKWENAGKRGRFGLHNDCFLSSPSDVGTYDRAGPKGENLRSEMAELSATTYFSGETCDANKPAIRADCANILAEGPQYHVNALNRTYYTAFHDTWRRQGCYATITDRMGYRLRLLSADVAGGTITLQIINEGWARVPQPRRLKLRASGESVTFAKPLDQIAPRETVTLSAVLPPGPAPSRVCLAAPDPSPRLAQDGRFALRFANTNAPGQSWAKGAFCFDL